MKLPLQVVHCSYAENGKTPVVVPGDGNQIHLYKVKLQNGTAGAIDMGILKRLSSDALSAYVIDASATPDAIASGLVDGTATNIFTATNNDGFLIQADYKFGLIGLNVSAAAAGGVFTYEYYNGTAFTTLTTLSVPSDYNSTGTKLIVFNAPLDWVAGTTAGVGGDTDKYSILVRGTTAPGDVVTANSLWVARAIDMSLSVAAKANLEFNTYPHQPIVLSGDEAILPYFGGSASASNTVQVIYSIQE